MIKQLLDKCKERLSRQRVILPGNKPFNIVVLFEEDWNELVAEIERLHG